MRNMFQTIMILTALIIGFTTLSGIGGADVYAACDDTDGIKLGDAITQECAQSNADVGTINNKIYNLVQILAGLVFGVSVLVIVYAGFKYATSQGEAKVTEGAKMQIISAGIGIGIALLAFVILNVFVTAFG